MTVNVNKSIARSVRYDGRAFL